MAGRAPRPKRVTLYTYQIGFRMLEVGKASALGVITLVIVAAMIAGLILLMSRRGREAF